MDGEEEIACLLLACLPRLPRCLFTGTVQGAASSESAAGSGRLLGSGPADVEPAAVSTVAWCSCGCVVGFGWL